MILTSSLRQCDTQPSAVFHVRSDSLEMGYPGVNRQTRFSCKFAENPRIFALFPRPIRIQSAESRMKLCAVFWCLALPLWCRAQSNPAIQTQREFDLQLVAE